MKPLLILFLLFFSLSAGARDWYHIYLVSKIYDYTTPDHLRLKYSFAGSAYQSKVSIPPFERPKGAIFCRMEDYLTTKTKVWIKVGVK